MKPISILSLVAVFLVAGGERALAAKLKVPQQFATIQAAVDAAVSGDVIIVAPGVYPENVDVTKLDLTIRGNGAIVDGGGADSCMVIGGSIGVTVEGLTFRNAGVDPALLIGLSIAVTIEGCKVRDTGGAGISVQETQAVDLHDNSIVDLAGPGIEVASNHVLIRDNLVKRVENDGLTLVGSLNTVVRNRISAVAGSAIAVGDGLATETLDNVLAENTLGKCDDGILAAGTADLRALDNHVSDAGDEGIDVQNSMRVLVHGNTIQRTFEEAVEVTGGCTDVTIDRNKCSAADENGMRFGNTTVDLMVSGNVVKGAALMGIALDADDSLLVKNKAANSGEFDLEDSGTGNVLIANTFGTIAPQP